MPSLLLAQRYPILFRPRRTSLGGRERRCAAHGREDRRRGRWRPMAPPFTATSYVWSWN